MYRRSTWCRGGSRPDAGDTPRSKRKASAADLQTGDSFRFDGETKILQVTEVDHSVEGRVGVTSVDAMGYEQADACVGVDVTLGYTNRKAKRRRRKSSRRARFAEIRA